MACANISASRTDPVNGAMHQCSLIQQVTGVTSPWIGDRFSANCSGDDLTTSACAVVINALLRKRVMMWQQPNAVGSRISLDAAFTLIISRQGNTVAAQVLVAAVTAGMPKAQATALATLHNVPLD